MRDEPRMRDTRVLLVRHGRPVREFRVRRGVVWRAATLGALALWVLPIALLAGIAAQAREDRARLAVDVATLAARTARLSSDVATLEHSVGLANASNGAPNGVPNRVPNGATSDAGGEVVDAPPLVDRASAADGWVDDLERRVGSVRGYVVTHLRALPTGTPLVARLSSGFGWRTNPFGGRDEYHAGIDLPAPYGAPVRATADGVVEFAGWRNGYGTAVGIKHADGFTTLFAHLSAATVHVGDRVARGVVVGRVGSEGHSTGPHVHYEVRRWGTPVDPRHVRFTPATTSPAIDAATLSR